MVWNKSFRTFSTEEEMKQSIRTRGGRVARKPKDGFLTMLAAPTNKQ